MRNALIVLVIVALVLVVLGALNHTVLFDIDFLAVTWTAVSLFWVAVAVAAVILVAGLGAAVLARSSAVSAQRKLEVELQSTYQRLRAAEAKIPEPAVPVRDAKSGAAAGAASADAAVTTAAEPEHTAVTVVEKPKAQTAVTPQAAEAAETGDSPAEQTAVTVVEVPPASTAGAGDTGEAPPSVS